MLRRLVRLFTGKVEVIIDYYYALIGTFPPVISTLSGLPSVLPSWHSNPMRRDAMGTALSIRHEGLLALTKHDAYPKVRHRALSADGAGGTVAAGGGPVTRWT